MEFRAGSISGSGYGNLLVMPLITFFIVLYLVSSSSSAPSGARLKLRALANSTREAEPPWKDGPAGRGTYNLLWSCLTTLSLCVWTAVHLNTYPNGSEMINIGRRLLWMAIAAFAPEYVLYCAFDQWQTARSLRKEINLIADKAIDGDAQRSVGWGKHRISPRETKQLRKFG